MFGAWPLIAGTLQSSAIALTVGFPIAVGAAVILVEKLPPRLAAVTGLLLEVLAGIPSAVIGIWGDLHLRPISRQAHLPDPRAPAERADLEHLPRSAGLRR